MIRRHRYALAGFALWSVLILLAITIPPAGPVLVVAGATASAGAVATEVIHHDRT